jgi:hypothetical protein
MANNNLMSVLIIGGIGYLLLKQFSPPALTTADVGSGDFAEDTTPRPYEAPPESAVFGLPEYSGNPTALRTVNRYGMQTDVPVAEKEPPPLYYNNDLPNAAKPKVSPRGPIDFPPWHPFETPAGYYNID